MTWINSLRLEHLDTPENILFLLGIMHSGLHPELLDYVSNFKDSVKMFNKYCEVNEDGEVVIKTEFLQNNFYTFIKKLADLGMGNKGHITNEMGYGIGTTSRETQMEFSLLMLEFENLDIDLLAEKVSEFYEKGEYLPKLNKWLAHNARIALMSA